MIVSLMSAGHTTPEIAKLLELRPSKVESHKRRIYSKLGVSGQSHAVATAISSGLLRARPLAPRRPGPPGRPEHGTLVVVHGQPGRPLDDVMRQLVSERIPFVAMLKQSISRDHWACWQRGPIVVILVDPQPGDLSPAKRLCAPTVVVRSRPIPGQLVLADALARQASGLISIADTTSGLGHTLRVVARGMFVIRRGYAEALLTSAGVQSPSVPRLTSRERDILGSIARGDTIRQTARALGIAAKTVENIQASLFRKLGARNRMAALATAYSWGLIGRATDPAGHKCTAGGG